MDKETLDTLKEKRRTTDITPSSYPIFTNSTFRNAEHTSDEKAAVGGTWKDFWQIFSQVDFPTVCPFCGKPLEEKDIDGCHINVKGLFGDWLPKKYIIPGHHDCNMKFGKEFTSRFSVNAVEAIEKDDNE